MNPLGIIIAKLRVRHLIRFADSLCRQHGISFSYKLGLRDADVLKDIFFKRVYATAFPFYQNCCIVDIGAHKGYFTLFASRYSGSDAKIISIEPEPQNFTTMVDTIKKNAITKVSAHQCAISGKTGKMQLYLSDSVNHSLLKVNSDHPYVKQCQCIDVDTYSLSDFMDKNSISMIEFLKIDCEGGEYDILFNTDDATFNKIKTIALEFHDIMNSEKNIYTLSNFLYGKGYKHVSTEFQDTQMPLNMGIVIITRN